MTPERLEELWSLGQQHEAEGALDAARAAFNEILAASPRQIMVQIRLSEIEQRSGRYRAALAHALEAADTIRVTQRWEGLAHVTANLLVFDERDVVRRLIEQADWNDARVIRQSPVLSQHLWMCGAEEAALRFLDNTRRRGVADHRLAYSRAMALQQLGRIADASDAFEECIRLAPDFAPAHWSLAYHAASVQPGVRIDRIRAAVVTQQEPIGSAMLLYALYKELDAADDRDVAWSELVKGAATMRQSLGPAVQPVVEASQLAPWQASPLSGVAAQGESGQVPIFIVGMPRTGTTLLSRIIGAHPAVADAGELNSLEQAVGEALDKFVDFPLPAADVATLGSMDPVLVAEGYMRRTIPYYVGEATHLIDKNPMNVFAAGIIAAAMPRAKVLCLARGAMDTCYSNLRQLFQNGAFGYSYDQRQLAERYVAFRAAVDSFKTQFPENFLEVSYEGLVADPATTSEAVMAFCGLDFEPGYADITRNTSPSATASNTQVREPIHVQAIGEWRRYEDKLQPLVERLGELGVAL